MKNQKMSTKITLAIFLVITVCICLLYTIANRSMTRVLKESAMKNLHASLDVQTQIIEEYIEHQEHLIVIYSKDSLIRDFLKNPEDEAKRKAAQEYTVKYFEGLDNWEGIYTSEWDTHVMAHSNEEFVGLYTREGEPLKELQDAMTNRGGLYNTGIIISPVTKKLILSMYCPVYDSDEKTILGYVGGGPFAEGLRELLISVEDDSTEYYMVNTETNTYIFAEDESLMATAVEDDMLLNISAKIARNENVTQGDLEYKDDDKGKSIAAYEYIPEYKWAVVSCNSEDNIYSDIITNINLLGALCVASVIIIVVISWILIRISTRPLKYVEKSILQLMELKLDKDHNLDEYIGCKSEVGQIATAIDSLYDSIEELLQAEKEKQMALAASESKSKFLANMSHEIRTPINTVIGMNEMILRESKDETINEYALNVKSASQMLLGLVNDILDFSKIEAGKIQLVEEDYHISSVIKDTILNNEERLSNKDLLLNLDIDEGLPKVLCGDELRIKQILNNLLSNAAKYTERGSVTLTVKGIREEDTFNLFIAVKDTGIGIKQEDIEQLFDSFQRLELKKNRSIEGSGLGLNITNQLVRIMGGTIKVESEYGKGSCFTVQIPQQVVDDTPLGKFNQSWVEEDFAGQDDDYLYAPKANVLAVDDNSMNLKVIKALLRRSEVKLDLAESGTECLQMTKNKKYDIILMDHMMPEPDGIQTLHMIRKDMENMNRTTKMVVFTANAIEGCKEQYLKEGFVDYLSKPVKVEALEKVLKRHLDIEKLVN